MCDVDSEASSDNQDSLCMILAEEKIRHHDRELQTDPSSGTFNLENRVHQQNRTLVNMLRVYCSRHMTDWDKYLPQVVGAYNSTQLVTSQSWQRRCRVKQLRQKRLVTN